MNNQNCWMAKRLWQRILIATSLMLAALAAQAQGAIEAVSGSIQGGVEVVKIDFTQPLPMLPNGFTVQSPARIALDFPGISSAMGRSTI